MNVAYAINPENVYAVRFRQDVLNGLKSNPKKLDAKYFYDKTGDAYFQQIMDMPEYYLTDCELDIFKNQTADMAAMIQQSETPFDLIELGAGDARKSTFLLRHLAAQTADFTYMPIDISENILQILANNLKKELPEGSIIPLAGEYFDMLEKAYALSTNRKVVLFLGSNIGNMELDEAEQFCIQLRRKLSKGDIVLMGFDLKKNPHTILKAYNDPPGITAKFNLNILSRINNELGANFNLAKFEHYQTYDPVTGACRSFLISLTNQQVKLDETTFSFAEHEYIQVEVSQKFTTQDIQLLASRAGFQPLAVLNDTKGWFVDVIWQVDNKMEAKWKK